EAPDPARVPSGPRRVTRGAVPARARRPPGKARARLRGAGGAREGARAAAVPPLEGAGSLQALAARHPGDQRSGRARPGVSGGVGGIRPAKFLWGLFRTARPEAYSRRQGAAFWDIAAAHGVRVDVLRVPYAFPPDRVPGGRMLSGLGVPDLLGTNSTFTYLASDLEPGTHADPGGGRLFPIPLRGDDAEVDIPGPTDPRGDSRPPLPLHLGFHLDPAPRPAPVPLRSPQYPDSPPRSPPPP